jgi:RNA polymerase sigma-70 factor (ECF subfamily)
MGSRRRAEAAAGAEPASPPAQPAVSAAHRQLHERVNQALASLQPQQRQVLELAYFGGLSQTEIASQLKTPLGTVKSWTRQGLARLRELLPQEEWT